MNISLYTHQLAVLDKLKNGNILCGGVGSGKSRTAITYYFTKECGGKIKINDEGVYSDMLTPKNLYIITTARKRDTFEWERECSPFILSTKPELSINNVQVIIDSWNNIAKYTNIKNSFFIFDEQRLVGSGKWVKSFLKIVKTNNWILLSATPGDNWNDYIPMFIANGFYKNRTEFLNRHAIYSRFTKYPKVDKYIDVNHLVKLKTDITVYMDYIRETITNHNTIIADFNKQDFNMVLIKRWNIFSNTPIREISELCYTLRRVVNQDNSRVEHIKIILEKHPKLIIFYNFNYELEILRHMCNELNYPFSEWNGHFHKPIPKETKWVYLVQYTAGAEGWNCIETDTILFYSQNYSYKIMVQSAGRIDRINTPFKELYYYHLISRSNIDLAISKSLQNKKNFNVNKFLHS